MDHRPDDLHIPLARAPWAAPALETPEEALAHEHAVLDELLADADPGPGVLHDDSRRAGSYTHWTPA